MRVFSQLERTNFCYSHAFENKNSLVSLCQKYELDTIIVTRIVNTLSKNGIQLTETSSSRLGQAILIDIYYRIYMGVKEDYIESVQNEIEKYYPSLFHGSLAETSLSESIRSFALEEATRQHIWSVWESFMRDVAVKLGKIVNG